MMKPITQPANKAMMAAHMSMVMHVTVQVEKSYK